MKRKASEFIDDSQYLPSTLSKRRNMGSAQSSILAATMGNVRDWISWLAAPFTPKTPTRESFSESPKSSPKPIKAVERPRKHKTQRRKDVDPGPSIDKSPKAGKGLLNYKDCEDEQEAARIYDKFWAPPDLIASTTRQEPVRPPPTPKTSTRDGPSRLPTAPRRGPSVPNRQKSIPSKSNVDDLSGSLARLLGPDGEGQEHHIYTPSTDKTKEILRKKKEKKAREEEAARVAKQQRRFVRRSPRRDLILPMSKKWEKQIDQLLPMVTDRSGTYRHQVVTQAPTGTEIRVHDFGTVLLSGEWLNDEIVNTYIEWIANAANEAANNEDVADGKKPSAVPRFVAHNSFFYQSFLISKRGKGTERLMKRKKVPSSSFFEVDSIFIPINKGNHWTIGVVRPMARTIEYLDSFHSPPDDFSSLAHNWLQDLLGNKYVESEWKTLRTRCAKQRNHYDCGVFVCTNALCVALGLDTACYLEKDLVQQRRNIAALLMNRGFTGDFAWEGLERL